MHRTNSLDPGIVMSGAIELELDDGQVTLAEAGTIIVQHGTIHAWRNPSADTSASRSSCSTRWRQRSPACRSPKSRRVPAFRNPEGEIRVKLATFIGDNGPEIGLVDGETLVPLATLLDDAPSDMVALIDRWDMVKDAISGGKGIALDTVRLTAPVLRPSKILAIGLNYADHIAETGRDKPVEQVWFGKLANTINGPFDPVEMPKVSTMIDYEVELVAVIGKRGRHIARDDAAAHVFGYMLGNDVTTRDWQRATPQWLVGKSFDTHAPMGPWITTADEIGDPHRLGIRCLVNGEVRQDSNTSELAFDVWDQIAHLSKAMTLEPGDLIFTGTPGGVGAAMKPPIFLRVGDVVRCEIDELGAIENVMAAEA